MQKQAPIFAWKKAKSVTYCTIFYITKWINNMNYIGELLTVGEILIGNILHLDTYE